MYYKSVYYLQMKLREHIYTLLIAFPTVIFTSIQVLLFFRFISKVIELDPQIKAVELLYTFTGQLVFPFVLVLNFFNISSDGILFEALLLPSVIIYALVYEIIRILIVKITMTDDEE
jgi:hypothetical protein